MKFALTFCHGASHDVTLKVPLKWVEIRQLPTLSLQHSQQVTFKRKTTPEKYGYLIHS